MIHPESHIVTLANGVRPAGPQDECFYCQTKVGLPHQVDCVLRRKTVMVQYTVTIPIVVPEYDGKDSIEFHRNESSWCANNALDDIIRAYIGGEVAGRCLCDDVECTYLREATEHDEKRFSISSISDEAMINDCDLSIIKEATDALIADAQDKWSPLPLTVGLLSNFAADELEAINRMQERGLISSDAATYEHMIEAHPVWDKSDLQTFIAKAKQFRLLR